MTTPPRDVMSKHQYYMGMAFLSAARSKDPSTQVGAFIVSNTNEPLSSGYNGTPRKIKDVDVDWTRPAKYPFIHHAEDNAIWHARTKNLEGASMYVTLFPCKSCMLDIVRAGIYNVIYFKDSKSAMLNSEEVELTRKIAEMGGVNLMEFEGDINWINDFVKNLKNNKFID